MKIIIKNGRVLDPKSGTDKITDILVEDGKIGKVRNGITEEADQIIQAEGCYVMPGFIDLHVHLRDPGQTDKETIETGGKAAAKGGFTTICAMPNTSPAADCAEIINSVHKKAKEESPVHVYQLGAITKGQAGDKLVNFKELKEAGTMAVSEDGKSVMDEALYKEAMAEAAKLDIPIFAHCEDISLVNGGVMNADEKAEQLGLPGITNEVEDIIVDRDIVLAKETGARLHLCHCSTKGSVELLKKAKEQGIPVTGEVCPHHFILSTDDITKDHGKFKMNPPLRKKEDVEALVQALKDGVLDVIATDHAPHKASEKDISMKDASFGIVGLETAAALTYTELVDKGVLTPIQMAERMSSKPAEVLKIDKGSLEIGKPADVVVFDPAQEYAIDKNQFESKGKNTPFHERQVKGKVICTVVDGKIVYQED